MSKKYITKSSKSDLKQSAVNYLDKPDEKNVEKEKYLKIVSLNDEYKEFIEKVEEKQFNYLCPTNLS